jgi:hypothetical protein
MYVVQSISVSAAAISHLYVPRVLATGARHTGHFVDDKPAERGVRNKQKCRYPFGMFGIGGKVLRLCDERHPEMTCWGANGRGERRSYRKARSRVAGGLSFSAVKMGTLQTRVCFRHLVFVRCLSGCFEPLSSASSAL